ncbi:unnamed protein product, partial [Amoebophrya sp. A25]
ATPISLADRAKAEVDVSRPLPDAWTAQIVAAPQDRIQPSTTKLESKQSVASSG